MGIYLNPGNTAFSKAIHSKIYVDKTELIKYTNDVLGTKQGNICVSRPRRFGKSMAIEMLAAYYSKGCNSEKLFADLKIRDAGSFSVHLNRHNVIFLNIQRFLSRAKSARELVPYLETRVLKELKQAYPSEVSGETGHLSEALEEIYNRTETGVLFLIDEWDCIFREKQHDIEAQTLFLDFLRDLLKDQPYVDLAYMTGILPIKKYGTHSALNMFDEYSMMDPGPLAEFVGFTDSEVKALCSAYQVDFQEMKRWYDGYQFADDLHIYSPKSVIDSLLHGRFSNYWTATETYEALKVYIEMDFHGLKDSILTMLGNGKCRINPRTFQNDMTSFKNRDDVLTLLLHLGYLAYDINSQEAFIPNQELAGEFENAVECGDWKNVADALQKSEELLKATMTGNSDMVENILDSVHQENTSILSYNNENSLSCVIALAYFSARKDYLMIREFPAGNGFADIVFLPRKASNAIAFVVELKWNHSAKGAISQIKKKDYVKSLESYTGNILLVGINYRKKDKKHECIIETHIKA
jgi:hypothetical protein|nr:AAA family ATPase [uncultured Schaedlerella sp.]